MQLKHNQRRTISAATARIPDMEKDDKSSIWPRPQWRNSGDPAVVLYFAFGDLGAVPTIPGERYRTRGIPPGVDVLHQRNAELATWPGYPLSGGLGRVLRQDQPHLVAHASRASDVLMLRGTLADPPSLDYLRDVTGVLTGLLDRGIDIVVDPLTLTIFDAASWHKHHRGDDLFDVRRHVLILNSPDDAPGTARVHTRGMARFARPDIDIRAVPAAAAAAMGQLAEQLASYQALGGIIAEGHQIDIEPLGQPLRARRMARSGSPEDNTRIEFVWPAAD